MSIYHIIYAIITGRASGRAAAGAGRGCCPGPASETPQMQRISPTPQDVASGGGAALTVARSSDVCI